MVEGYLHGRARVSQHAKVRNDGVVVACGGTVRGTYGTPELSAAQGEHGETAACPVPLVRTARRRLVRVSRRYGIARLRGTARLRASSKEARLRHFKAL